MAARTENGKNAFLVDLEKTSPHEDQHQLRLVDRARGLQRRYHLRHQQRVRLRLPARQPDHAPGRPRRSAAITYAIVDEVDNILIDEARTPLIISGPASDDTEWYVRMAAGRAPAAARRLRGQRERPHRLPDRDRRGARGRAAGHSRCATPTAPKMSPPSRPACWATWNRPCAPSSSSTATRITWCRAARWSSWTSSPGA